MGTSGISRLLGTPAKLQSALSAVNPRYAAVCTRNVQGVREKLNCVIYLSHCYSIAWNR